MGGSNDMAMATWVSGGIMIVVLSGPPTDDEWSRWVEVNRKLRDQKLRVIVESHGSRSAPDATQRKTLAEVLQGTDVRVAVLTDSLLTRGIVTALAWLGVPQKAFDFGLHRQAGAYLELTSSELEQILAELPRLRRTCGLDALHTAAG